MSGIDGSVGHPGPGLHRDCLLGTENVSEAVMGTPGIGNCKLTPGGSRGYIKGWNVVVLGSAVGGPFRHHKVSWSNRGTRET